MRTTHDMTDAVPVQEKNLLTLALRKGGLVIFLLGQSCLAAGKTAADDAVMFNDAFLPKTAGKTLDVSRFAHGNPVMTGVYHADVYVNGNAIGKIDIPFAPAEGGPDSSAIPCFNQRLLRQIGVDVTRLHTEELLLLSRNTSSKCSPLARAIPQATTSFDVAEQKLDVSIPQILMLRTARGYVSPEYWDAGVDAGFIGYNFNSYHVDGDGQASSWNNYLGLNAGLNLGDWHFRHNASVTAQTGNGTHYQSIATYAQRDLPALQSQLVIGDTFTSGEIFDSVSLRGLQIFSDDRMLPESQRGYAPVVRGIADTNARVTIMQNGNILYETTVAAGPFEINDLYPTGYGGALEVRITESDGRQRTFSVPYAALPQLVRAGSNRFSLAAGMLREQNTAIGLDQPQQGILQGTLQHGISNSLTAYTGGIVAQGYYAGLAGSALNTRLGAFAADLTLAQTVIPYGADYNGQSLRLSYSKLLPESGTNFSMAAYRYSSSHYFSLVDAMQARRFGSNGLDPELIDRQRSQLQVTINQTLAPGLGSFYLTGSSRDFWNREGSDTQYQLGYNNNYRRLTYSVSASRQHGATEGETLTQYLFSCAIPLGSQRHSPVLTSRLGRNSKGEGILQEDLTGSAGRDDEFSYGLHAGGDNQSSYAGANAGYRSPYANFSASYSQSSIYRQSAFGVAGGVVVHPGGITLSQPLGDTIGIVAAADADGARVSNSAGLRIDGRGYAVVPWLSPYAFNLIEIDPQGMSPDVQLGNTLQRTAPHAGAIVMLKFDTLRGRSVLIHAPQSDGQPLPFGATVWDEAGRNIGLVGQASRLFVRTANDQGTLSVRWGEQRDEQCKLAFRLAPANTDGSTSLTRTESVCRPDGAGTFITRNP